MRKWNYFISDAIVRHEKEMLCLDIDGRLLFVSIGLHLTKRNKKKEEKSHEGRICVVRMHITFFFNLL